MAEQRSTATATTTSKNASAGRRKSKRAASTAGAADGQSSQAKRGTSATTTKTAGTTRGRSTSGATGVNRAKGGAGSTGQPRSGSEEPLEIGSSVVASLTRDLEELQKVAPELATGALAAMAMALARSVDQPDNATAKSNAANSLLNALEQLRALAPAQEEADGLDDLTTRRALRLAGTPAS